MKDNLIKIVISVVFLSLLMVLSVSASIVYLSLDLPDAKQLMNYSPPIPSQILTQEGDVLLKIGREQREMVDIDKIPPRVIDAFLASEDSKFFDHNGVDYTGMVRAFVANMKAGRVVQGGSTITQQVAKMLLLSSERSFVRKIKDVLLAKKIETIFTKKEILYFYLNHIYLGGGYYGVKAAFKGYFDKELEEATVAESALIAGLLVAPGRYSPYMSPYHSKKRQRYVLARMLEEKKITRKEYEVAYNEEIRIRIRQNSEMPAGHFVDWIRQKVIQQVGEENFLVGGFKVITTLNAKLQRSAEAYIDQGLREIDKRQGFSGPLEHLATDEEMRDYTIQFRKDFFERQSIFFWITSNGEKRYELGLDVSEFKNIEKQQKDRMAKALYKYFSPGNVEDRLSSYLVENKFYNALVERVDDQQRLIYVSIGGVKGIIPQAYYEWAHPRRSPGKSNSMAPITNPSTILKRGDVIQIKVLNKAVPIWNHLAAAAKKEIQDQAVIKELKNEFFYLCQLEQDPVVEGALVSLNARTGEVLALVGGRDFNQSKFNRAIQSLRQPGSCFKPLLYAVALENGYTPADIIIDSPEALSGMDGKMNWKPMNYDGDFVGAITFRKSLEQSRNVPTIRIAADVGLKKIFEFIKRVNLHVNPDYDLSIALGTFGVSLMNLTATYAIFPNGGKKVVPKYVASITDRNGKEYYYDGLFETPVPATSTSAVKPKRTSDIIETGTRSSNLYTGNLSGRYVYDERLAYLMTSLLRGVVQSGTAKAARGVGTYIAGKTGTTNDYVDAWFVGFTRDVVTGVWTGFDDNKPLGPGETGARSALPIWQNFTREVVALYGDHDFRQPDGIVNVMIDRESGKLASEETANAFLESFVEGTEPGGKKSFSPDEQAGPVLDDDYFLNQ